VFGAVLFSLVGQGLSLPWMVKRLKISRVSDVMQEAGQLQIQSIATPLIADSLDKSGKRIHIPIVAVD
jgi:CPA1 family monovalent cation:H+ antiporter